MPDGSPGDAQADASSGSPCFTEVSLGRGHACGVLSDGSLWCWGRNDYGELGVGDTSACDGLGYCTEPMRVGDRTDWTVVTTGQYHTCAVRSDHTLWCWGRNGNYGQLGLGDATECGSQGYCAEPTRVGADSNWVDVNAGNDHVCGLRSDGTLWCWGRNQWGQLGLGDADCAGPSGTCPTRLAPEQVGSAATWTDVVAASWHTCGQRSDGSLWCWGSNAAGQLGLGDTDPRTSPTQVAAPVPATGWTAVALGVGGSLGLHTCGIDSDGFLYCWGRNQEGELGIGSTGGTNPDPQKVGVESDWLAIAAGWGHTCGIRSGGSLWCWGTNLGGQLGLGDQDPRNAPSPVAQDTVWAEVYAGLANTCAIDETGALWCWGENDYGQVGVGDTDPHLEPAPVACPSP